MALLPEKVPTNIDPNNPDQGDDPAAQGQQPEAELEFEAAAVARLRREAEEEAEAARTGGDGAAEGAAPGQTPAQAPQQQPQGQAGAPKKDGADPEGDHGQVPMIPKPRFDAAVQEERSKRQDAERNVIFLQGQLAALKTTQPQPQAPGAVPAGQPAPQPRMTHDQIIGTARTEILRLAKQCEDGDITVDKFEEERLKLDDVIADARQAKTMEALKQATKSDAPKGQTSRDMYLDTLTAKLEQEHPFTLYIGDPKTDPLARSRWDSLETEAISGLSQEGVRLVAGDPQSQYAVRERMAKLTDTYGPIWTGKTLEEITGRKSQAQTGAAPTGGTPPAPKLTPKQQAGAAKIDLADRHPPDIGNLGSSGGNTEVTAEDIEAMTFDEIMALPDAVRRKFMP